MIVNVWGSLSTAALVAFNAVWISLVYLLYDACRHKAGWFSACFTKLQFVMNLVMSAAMLLIVLHLMCKHVSSLRVFFVGTTLLIIQIAVTIYVLD